MGYNRIVTDGKTLIHLGSGEWVTQRQLGVQIVSQRFVSILVEVYVYIVFLYDCI